MEKTSRSIAIAVVTALILGAGPGAAADNNNGNNNNGSNNGGNTTTTTTSTSGNTTSSQTTGSGLATGDVCYTAVYDQQDNGGTFAHYGKGEWDADRQLCMHVNSYTQSFIKDVGAVEAAQTNPFIHVMYVIDRTKSKLYAPCGVNSNSDQVGVLGPGTYDLNTLNKVDANVPNLGAGANCLISG